MDDAEKQARLDALKALGDAPWQHEVDAFDELPLPEPPEEAPPTALPPPAPIAPVPITTPPSARQIVEAMLFAGGSPVTAERACSAIRGFTAAEFQQTIETIARTYRMQNRPYAVQPQAGGYAVAVLPKYRAVRERLFGGPKEAKLGPAAVDLLSLIAYRQPISRAELEEYRSEALGLIRQLLRLGLIVINATGDEPRYSTTAQFLKMFELSSLDDLPQLGGPVE